jgi:hypothetical protein
MESSDVINEISRIQREHGSAPVVIADAMESWQHLVTGIRFDPVNQTIVIAADR